MRTAYKGTLQFGLLAIPMRLGIAAGKPDGLFHQMHGCGARIGRETAAVRRRIAHLHRRRLARRPEIVVIHPSRRTAAGRLPLPDIRQAAGGRVVQAAPGHGRGRAGDRMGAGVKCPVTGQIDIECRQQDREFVFVVGMLVAPLVAVVGGRRGLAAVSLLACAMAMTQVYYPLHFDPLRTFAPLQSWAVVGRDALMVTLLATLAWPDRTVRIPRPSLPRRRATAAG